MKIKVITLNVWHGGRLWDEMINFLKQEDADVLILQEVHSELDGSTIPQQRTLQEFRRIFDYPVEDFSPQYNWDYQGIKVAHGSAIVSKLPLLKRHEPVYIEFPFNPDFKDS